MVQPSHEQRFKRRRTDDTARGSAAPDGRPHYRDSYNYRPGNDWKRQRRHSVDHRSYESFHRRPPQQFQHHQRQQQHRGSLPSYQGNSERRRSIAWIPPSQVKQNARPHHGEIPPKKDITASPSPNPNTDRNQQTKEIGSAVSSDHPQESTPKLITAALPRRKGEFRNDETFHFQFTAKEGRMVETTDPTVASTATQITLEKVMPPSEVVLQSKMSVSDFSPSPPNHGLTISPDRNEETMLNNNIEQTTKSLNKPTKDRPDCTDLSLLKVGSRVAIYWENEQQYFKAFVKKHDASRAKPFYIRYDDGDREWVSFENERFRLLKKRKKKKLEVSNTDNNSRPEDAPKEEPLCISSELTVKKHAERGRSSGDKTTGAGKTRGLSSTTRDDKENLLREATQTGRYPNEGDWVIAGLVEKSSSDSDTDEEELGYWAHKMLGAPLPKVRKEPNVTNHDDWGDAVMSISEKVKLGRSRNSAGPVSDTMPAAIKPIQKKRSKNKAEKPLEPAMSRKEQTKPLTAEEIRAILAEDCPDESGCSSWVRRSMRQPSKSALDSPRVKDLIHKLTTNDQDMVILKMKKYCSDLDTPQIVIDAVLDALEDNTNCEALYIQNFNEGVRDEQVLHLLKILQQPSCNIWCLNIGETYKVRTKTWKKFARGLRRTKITHMYASEHTISTELKDFLRSTIRDNRQKHSMHIDPNNLATIVRCTHCWWNPINAKCLRPYIRQAGYEQILEDAEALGLRGTSSGATLS